MQNAFRLCLLLTMINTSIAAVAADGAWNGKRAAVVLTYDDSLNIHLDKVVPALNQRGLLGTFYLTVNPGPFSERMGDWRTVAAQGHELGNHTLFHPCIGKKPGREWVTSDYDLNNYSVQRMVDEIVLTNRILESVDGLTERTLAYTCGDTQAGGVSFVEEIKPYFVAARGVANSFSQPDEVDFFNINAYMVHEQSAQQLIAQAETALKDGAMLVYLFHGVGGEHPLNVSAEAHDALLDYLKKNSDKIWVTSMVKAAKFLQDKSRQQ